MGSLIRTDQVHYSRSEVFLSRLLSRSVLGDLPKSLASTDSATLQIHQPRLAKPFVRQTISSSLRLRLHRDDDACMR